jgi:hypothetical protein
VLGLARAHGTHLSEEPDLPSLPASVAFYHMRWRLTAPDSLLSASSISQVLDNLLASKRPLGILHFTFKELAYSLNCWFPNFFFYQLTVHPYY